jgi:beta-galactosidase/beta-glucuronidase
MLFAAGFAFAVFSRQAGAQQAYHMQPVPIQSRWAKEVSPANALKEYPRPQMERGNWQNLNGLWDYAITAKDAAAPVQFDGQILVPFPLESALSGVKKSLQPDQNLWYRRAVNVQPWSGKHVLLHFGAVDFQATVFINGKEAGGHTGGYTAFTLDITSLLKAGDNQLTVKVWDPTDQGYGPHGKQVLNPQNIYYTPTSGIWQTVWLEEVPDQHISGITLTPDIDHQQLDLKVNLGGAAADGLTVEAVAMVKGKKMAEWDAAAASGNHEKLIIPSPRLWSPADPFLYDLVVSIKKDGRVIDQVKSYFGMRKISVAKDGKGIDRICLNNKPYYNLGVLDQGFWPEGLYTAPTDEALAFDIKAIKSMGFNTIRKHIKVEPARWYYWADKLGMLVWQDMVNPNQGLPEGAKQEFEKESAEILEQLHNSPAITTWVLFNEKWGQYDQARLTKWIKDADPSRIVNGHTGELLYVNEQLRSPSPDAYVNADMTDVHSYPDPMMPVKQAGKAQVLGEFGGIGVFTADHQWITSSAWGYIQEKPAALLAKYKIMNQELQLLEREGLSGSIYTQPFDVEGEQNGLMTYDREVVKMPFAEMRKIHQALNPEMGSLPQVTAKDADITDPQTAYSAMLQEYIGGKRDAAFLKRMAMMASQAGDKAGALRAGSDYVATLKAPLSKEDIDNIVQFSPSTKSPGYQLIIANKDQFVKALGERRYTVTLMNMIYHGEMEEALTLNAKPDWNAIEAKIRPFGAPGEEIFLRAKTVALFNAQDWPGYVSVAKQYLEKYGKNLQEQERNMFQQAIDQHKDASN